MLDALDLKTLDYQIKGVGDEVRDGRSCRTRDSVAECG